MLLPALVLMLAFAFSMSAHCTIQRHTRCRWPSSARPRSQSSSTACQAIPSMLARRRRAPTRSRRSTIARSTVPMRQPRTTCSWPRPQTGRPPSRSRDVRPRRRRPRPAGRPRHRRQAAASKGFQRHRGVLRGDRVGVRRLHRLDADRVDREPPELQPAARCRAARGARGISIVAGILSVVMLRASFDVFSGHVVGLCAIAALTMLPAAPPPRASRPRSVRQGPGS